MCLIAFGDFKNPNPIIMRLQIAKINVLVLVMHQYFHTCYIRYSKHSKLKMQVSFSLQTFGVPS